MALIFRAIFGEMLPQEDLVEVKERDRLPSPEDLQRKIILKSSVKESEPAKVYYIEAITVTSSSLLFAEQGTNDKKSTEIGKCI